MRCYGDGVSASRLMAGISGAVAGAAGVQIRILAVQPRCYAMCSTPPRVCCIGQRLVRLAALHVYNTTGFHWRRRPTTVYSYFCHPWHPFNLHSSFTQQGVTGRDASTTLYSYIYQPEHLV